MTEMRTLVLASELETAQIGQDKKRRKALLTPVFQLEFPVDDCTESRDVQCPCATYAYMYIVYSRSEIPRPANLFAWMAGFYTRE